MEKPWEFSDDKNIWDFGDDKGSKMFVLGSLFPLGNLRWPLTIRQSTRPFWVAFRQPNMVEWP
jgi:hypothetical protein